MRQNTNKRKEMNEEAINVVGNQLGTAICNGIIRYHRQCRPAHYMLQIHSYSALAASKLQRYESDIFQAGGHEWRMVLYIKGKSEVNNKGSHISMYIAIAETQAVDLWAHFKFFLHDQINDKYMVIEDVHNHLKRFYSAKKECGFDELFLLDAFKDVNNGYLVNDSCAFGAEVFVADFSPQRACVSVLLKPPEYGTYTWKLNNFSQIGTDFCSSESFTVGGKQWLLKVYPKGDEDSRNDFFSIFLVLNEPAGNLEMKIIKICYAEFTLRLKNQLSTLRNMTVNGEKWFNISDNSWGLSDFMKLKDLKDKMKGYYVNDTVIIECQFSFMSEGELLEE